MFRFSYLWKREAAAGRENGVKDRPCAVIVVVDRRDQRPRVIALPLTHSRPQPPDEGLELPQATKMRLNLDGERSWVIVSEGNDFIWPGPDIRFPPGQGPTSAAYGFLPPRVFQAVRDSFLARYRRRQVNLVTRSD